MKAYIVGNYGDAVSTMMTDFGYGTPKKKSTPTAAAKAQAVVQGQATRAARGTKGSKQKFPFHRWWPGTQPGSSPQAASDAPRP